MDPSWFFPFADFILKPVYIDSVWDPEYVFHLDFEALQLIMCVANTCSHFRKYMHSRVEYFAVKLAFWLASQMQSQSWISPAQEVVSLVRPIWSDMKKLHCGPNAALHRELFLQKPLEEMTPEELMCLRENLRRSLL